MSKLEEAIKEINKKCKINVITTEASGEWGYDNKIPFTSPCLNWSLYGGIPLGILLQIAGGENGGKTTLSMSICGQAQRQFKREYEDELAKLQAIEKPNATQKMRLAELLENGQRKVLWCDAESTFDEEWAVKNGMEMSSDSLYFFKPAVQSAESIFDIIRQLAETGVFGLIVLDSIGVLQSAKDLTSSYDDYYLYAPEKMLEYAKVDAEADLLLFRELMKEVKALGIQQDVLLNMRTLDMLYRNIVTGKQIGRAHV